MVYTVALPNGTNASNATNATPPAQHVFLSMKLDYVNYELLAASWQLVGTFTTMIKAAIGEAAHVPPAAVKVSLFPGSTIVETQITPPPGTAPAAILAFLANGTACNETIDHFANTDALQSITNGGVGIDDCSVKSLEVRDSIPA